MRKPQGISVGCQTNAWPLDPANPTTLFAALESIRDLGFHGYETGFRFVVPHFDRIASFRRELESTGLQLFGIHIFLEEYSPDTGIAPSDLWNEVASGAAVLGAQWLVLSGRAASAGGFLDFDALHRKTEALNRVGEQCAGLQLGLAYHNHHHEFAADGAEMEKLLAETDSGLVSFLADAGHAFRASIDFASFFQRHHSRICAVHLRDFRDDDQVPLGQGEFDLRPLAEQVAATSWKGWLFAEEERLSGEKPGPAAAGPARQHIRKIFGV